RALCVARPTSRSKPLTPVRRLCHGVPPSSFTAAEDKPLNFAICLCKKTACLGAGFQSFVDKFAQPRCRPFDGLRDGHVKKLVLVEPGVLRTVLRPLKNSL